MAKALGLAIACLVLVAPAGARPAAGPPLRSMHVVFWSGSPWPSIWSVRADGSRLHRILRNRQNAKRPRLSPDKRWVAFDGAPPGQRPLSNFDVQVVRVDGRQRRSLTSGPEMDIDAQWSPDGSRLAFSRAESEPSDLEDFSTCVVRRDGGDLRCLGVGSGARWSPDGKRLVFTAPSAQSRGDLYVMGADGSNRRRLFATRAAEQPEDWSPDGRRILFTRYYDATGRDAEVMVMRANGTGVRRLASGRSAVWSPDGRRILFIRNYSELYVMNADGSRKRTVGGIVSAFEPDWR